MLGALQVAKNGKVSRKNRVIYFVQGTLYRHFKTLIKIIEMGGI